MQTIFRNPDVMWREEDDATFEAMDLLEKGENAEEVGTSLLFADGMMVSLNILGTEIWKRCDGRTVEDLLAELLDEFDVEPEVLRQDMDSFLQELSAKGFIRYE
jgi:GeoRSP system PqqD family protein